MSSISAVVVSLAVAAAPPPIEIGLGQLVEDEASGNIVYALDAEPGALVYFDALSARHGVRWQCTDDQDGFVVRDTPMRGPDPGTTRLERGGRYTITVTGDGACSFIVWRVPSEVRHLALGDRGLDACIERPGAMDVYTFDAPAGAMLYFDERSGGCATRWECIDPRGRTVFSDAAMCIVDPGGVPVELGGAYTVTVADRAAASPYAFAVRMVAPPEHFVIGLDEVVAEGVQGAGAASIEAPGVTDIYSFEIAQPTGVCLEVLESRCGIVWVCGDPNGDPVFRESDMCARRKRPLSLTEPGTYTIVVSSRTTGAYSFVVGNAGLAEMTGDCHVDDRDLLRLLESWDTPDADVTGDGVTDLQDLIVLLSEWG